MRLCVIAGNFPARSETFILEHVMGMVERGHQVTVLSRGPGEGVSTHELSTIDAKGVVRVNLPSVPKMRLRHASLAIFCQFRLVIKFLI